MMSRKEAVSGWRLAVSQSAQGVLLALASSLQPTARKEVIRDSRVAGSQNVGVNGGRRTADGDRARSALLAPDSNLQSPA